MPVDFPTPIPDSARRAAPDLVASDEALTSILLGLEHLKRRLEIAQKKQAEAKAAARARLGPNFVRPELEEAPRSSDRQWYYAPEVSGGVPSM